MKTRNHAIQCNAVNFKSGITKYDINRLNKVTVPFIDNYLNNACGIDSKLNNNKTFSILNLICSSLLKRLGNSKQLEALDFAVQPKQIRIFDEFQLAKKFPDTFCTSASKKVLINEPIFKPRSLFFKNHNTSIEEMDKMAQNAKQQGFIASDNFLAFVMHEWMHNIHFNCLYKKNGDSEKQVLEYIKQLKRMEFTEKEKAAIRQYLGNYVYNGGKINPIEVVAESLNKIVCSCLDKKHLGINSDIDTAAQRMPEELMEILKKILIFSFIN